MGEDGCPACGALPCDWCWSPHDDKDSEVVVLRAQLSALQAKVDALTAEPTRDEVIGTLQDQLERSIRRKTIQMNLLLAAMILLVGGALVVLIVTATA